MAEIDDELVARAIGWCAEAGRHATADGVRAALARLSWAQLLAARALLADPPPARPLGPEALADLARGAPPDLAAERERQGRYRPEAEPPAVPPPAPPGRAAAPATGRRQRVAGPRIRRARDRSVAAAPSPPELPPIEALARPEGRSVLERLLRRHGGRGAALVRALAGGWRRADGRPVGEADLRALLALHGLARAFERREREAALHALRAAGGLRARAAADLELSPEALDALLVRTGGAPDAEAIRERRRAALRRRATLAERARLLLGQEERIADLGLLDEFLADLRARLPEHLRALRAAGGAPLPVALGRSLSLSRADVEALAARLGVDLGPAAPRAGPGAARRPAR